MDQKAIIHDKFQRIRKVYKEKRKWKKNGILNLFGIPKPEERSRSIFDREFNINDIIKNARKGTKAKQSLPSNIEVQKLTTQHKSPSPRNLTTNTKKK
mmetsp:Transcript_23686/g.21049  ORF Transcript_23686/g.21049 Transcript_23686/m.21049 type:complete len:98 (-) Transcript_23686:567-860(-)